MTAGLGEGQDDQPPNGLSSPPPAARSAIATAIASLDLEASVQAYARR